MAASWCAFCAFCAFMNESASANDGAFPCAFMARGYRGERARTLKAHPLIDQKPETAFIYFFMQRLDMSFPFPKTAAQFRKHIRASKNGWIETAAPKEPEDSTTAPKVIFDLGDYAHVSFEYGKLIVNLSQSYFFELDRLHELDWLEHVRRKNWVTLDVIQLLRRLNGMFPKPPPARTLPLETLEMLAQLAGTGCNSHEIWDGLALAAETFDGAARRAGGCAECPPFDGPCPDDGLEVSRMLLGMLRLIGVTSTASNGYPLSYQKAARWLERDIKAFAPKPPRQGTRRGRKPQKRPG
jgi:hypothetical protein